MRLSWQFFNACRHFCHWWQKVDERRLPAMVTALILLALLIATIVTIRAVRRDGYGTTAPPATFEDAPDSQPQLAPRLLP